MVEGGGPRVSSGHRWSASAILSLLLAPLALGVELGFRLEEPSIARVVVTRVRAGEPRLFESTALPLRRPPANPVPAPDR